MKQSLYSVILAACDLNGRARVSGFYYYICAKSEYFFFSSYIYLVQINSLWKSAVRINQEQIQITYARAVAESAALLLTEFLYR